MIYFRILTEYLFAVVATVRPFVRVDAQMLHKVRLLTEAFMTVGTIEWSFVRVSSFVLRQCRLLFESSTADLIQQSEFNIKFELKKRKIQ